jgi:hypothetical protein
MTQADSVLSTPRTTAPESSPTNPFNTPPADRLISPEFVLFTVLLSLLAAPAVAIFSFLVW